MPEQFSSQRLQWEDVQSVLCRVVARPLSTYSARVPEERPSSVTVTLGDGSILTRTLPDYPGFPTQPQTWEDVVSKVSPLAAPHIADAAITEIAKRCTKSVALASPTEPAYYVATRTILTQAAAAHDRLRVDIGQLPGTAVTSDGTPLSLSRPR